ncbi:MAG: hypothetical protein ABW185_06685 [Sedimenticola sp.]
MSEKKQYLKDHINIFGPALLLILLVFLIAYQFAQLALIDLTPQMTQQVQGGDGWRELLNRSNQNRCYT